MGNATQHSTAFQVEAVRLAKSKGIRPEQLTPADIASINVRIRSTRELVADGLKAAKSVVATSLGKTVPLHVYNTRLASCRACPHAILMAGSGSVTCGICGCSGALMDAALQDPGQSCRLPDGRKRWEAYEPNQH